MKGTVYDSTGKEVKQVALPHVFQTDIRREIIRRAVLSDESKIYQPKGSYRWAGLETSAEYVGNKEQVDTLKNKGQAKLPREFFGGGVPGRVRYIPQSVKGRRAHPPKPQKILIEKVNKKEYDLALRSALAATAHKDLVVKRGHKISGEVPIILEGVEKLAKTKDVNALFEKLFPQDMERAGQKRGRNKKHPKSALVIISKQDVPFGKAASNLTGIDVVPVTELQVMHLAPGTLPGRLTVITGEALSLIADRWKA